MHILDTDTLTHLQKRNSGVIENLEKVESYDVVGITIVTRAEVLRGRLEFLLKADDRYLLDKAQNFCLIVKDSCNKFQPFNLKKNLLQNLMN